MSNRLPEETDEFDEVPDEAPDDRSDLAPSLEEQHEPHSEPDSASEPVQYTSMCTVRGFFLAVEVSRTLDCWERIVLLGETSGLMIGETDLRTS